MTSWLVAALFAAVIADEPQLATMKEKPAEFFRLIPQAGVSHLITEDDLHNAIWDMAVSPEGRVFFGACGETYGSVYARMYEFLPDDIRLVRHFDLEKRIGIDDIGLRTSKFHTSMSFLGDHKLLTTTHTTSPSPRHPVWMPYEYYNHKFEGFKGSDLLIWDYETNETKGLGKFTSHDTIYGATYDPKNGDYFGITCLLGRGYVYNLKDGSVRKLGQVTDSRTSKTFLCSDGHIYGSTYSGAMFRYNTDKRDIEYLGLHINGILRQAYEWKGVLYFFTGTCGRPNCGMDFYAYDLKAGTLRNLGCPVPLADRLPGFRPDELPQYHAYGMTMDGEGRLWYACHTVTPTIRYPGVRLYLWDFLRGKQPVDCGFLGTKVRTASEVGDIKWLKQQNMLVIADTNHNSDKDEACGIISIKLDEFLPALADKSSPRLFSHDYINYLPYPKTCWKYYPKSDWDDCYRRFVKYYREVTVYFKQFAKDNAFRISNEGASGVSVWEKTGRDSSAVKAIRWTSDESFSFWTGGKGSFRADCKLNVNGVAELGSLVSDAVPSVEPLEVAVPDSLKLPSVPGRQYLAKASASVRLDNVARAPSPLQSEITETLLGTKDGMLALVRGNSVRPEGNVMTMGPVIAMTKSVDGSVWGISAHDEGLGYVFRWTRSGGLEILGVPPDVKAANGRNVHIFQPSAIAVSPDGRHVAVGGSDEIAGVTVFPVNSRCELRTDSASCVIDTAGARVISYKVRGEEVMWNDNPIQSVHPDWVHGGMPVCWPWFSRKPNDRIHGFAWRRQFEVVSRTEGPKRSELVLRLADGGLELTWRLTLTDELTIELLTANRTAETKDFSMAFHPYFRVGESERARVVGLTPEPLAIGKNDGTIPCEKSPSQVARIVDPVLERTLVVSMDNVTGVNVWNPGTVLDNVPGVLPQDAWRSFVAIEPVCGKFRQPVRLSPGEVRNLRISVSVSRWTKR